MADAAPWAALAPGEHNRLPASSVNLPLSVRNSAHNAAYNTLLLVALPWVLGRLYWRSWREPAYRERIGERFGGVPRQPPGAVWFHTVSAGEANAAAPIIRAFHERRPGRPLLVTTMTPAGSERVRALLGGIATHCYAPYDYPWAVRRFLGRVRPKALVLMETELWPNTIAAAVAGGAGAYLVNARLSDRAARRYARVRRLMAPTLARLDGALCQYEDTARRLRALGAGRVAVTGSVKFDAEPPADQAAADMGGADTPTWIAGSTHPGEEAVLLAAHRRLRQRCPRLRLILVPRHPARAAEVAGLVRQHGFSHALLSERQAGENAAVLVVDVMGALAGLYGVADVAFVGGSLDRTGGHNPIEAALHGVPFLMGPARFKIEEIWRRFASAQCCHPVRDAADIADAVQRLLENPERRLEEGRRAKAVVAANRGATKAVVERLCAWIDED